MFYVAKNEGADYQQGIAQLASHMQKQINSWPGSYLHVRRLANYNGQSG